MNRRNLFKAMLATVALTTGLGRTSLVLADGAGFESESVVEMVTREALRIAHEKLQFLQKNGGEFASGKMRLEGSEYSLSIDSLSERYIDPAVRELIGIVKNPDS